MTAKFKTTLLLLLVITMTLSALIDPLTPMTFNLQSFQQPTFSNQFPFTSTNSINLSVGNSIPSFASGLSLNQQITNSVNQRIAEIQQQIAVPSFSLWNEKNGISTQSNTLPNPSIDISALIKSITQPVQSAIKPVLPIIDIGVKPAQTQVKPPVQPVQPSVKPVQPVKPPVQPIQPSVKPVQPVKPPVQPVKPPVQPVQPAIEPVKPDQPKVEVTVKPVDPPVEPPVKPNQPAVPGTQIKIEESENLTNINKQGEISLQINPNNSVVITPKETNNPKPQVNGNEPKPQVNTNDPKKQVDPKVDDGTKTIFIDSSGSPLQPKQVILQVQTLKPQDLIP